MKIKLQKALIDVTNNKVRIKDGQILKVDYVIKEKRYVYHYMPDTGVASEAFDKHDKVINYVATYKRQEYVIPTSAAKIIK